MSLAASPGRTARISSFLSQGNVAPLRNLGPWELVRFLGAGNFSRVYSARPTDSPLDGPTDYALKVVSTDHAHAELTVALLRREAGVTQAVTHPHLVSVLGAQLEGPQAYLVLPFLRGVTLRDVLEAQVLPPLPHALWLIRQTAEALVALHGACVRHGDVKPDNIMVAPNGHVTLFDLGFAQPFASHSAIEHGLLGTPQYLAPELLHGGAPCNGLTDIYSLGVTLYELLAGEPPFGHGDPVAMAMAHLREAAPEVRELARHVPPRLARLVKRMLAKEPLRRPTAEEAVALLTEIEIDTLAEREPRRLETR